MSLFLEITICLYPAWERETSAWRILTVRWGGTPPDPVPLVGGKELLPLRYPCFLGISFSFPGLSSLKSLFSPVVQPINLEPLF